MEGIESRYKILRTLGSGGMGTVYLAESLSLGTLWAIKAIDKKRTITMICSQSLIYLKS